MHTTLRPIIVNTDWPGYGQVNTWFWECLFIFIDIEGQNEHKLRELPFDFHWKARMKLEKNRQDRSLSLKKAGWPP